MSLLDVLPPSPPTTASRKAIADGPCAFLATPIAMSTPEDSPASMPGSSNPGSRKKVEFCAQPNVYNAAVFASSPEQAASIKPLPPSREHRPARRSILKPPSQTEVSIQSMDGQQEVKLSVNENMDSIVQQLSKNDKPTSLDAYNTLASLFRAYEELPEAIVLKNKLSTLIRYIRRDLACQDKGDEQPTDTNLILSALKLLIILVWNTHYSPLLTDEAKIFILDRSIQVISEHRASKNVIAHYLHLLSTQDFRPPVMAANNRAGRLLDALKELPNHVTSSAVVSETIMVLARLTDQARPVMKAKADFWVEILLKTMVTASKDTRQKAIAFGMKACSAFATTPSVSAAFRDMLKRETDTNTTFEVNACKRLRAMFEKSEDAAQVPQIWATVLLLAVKTSENVEEWTLPRNGWLVVIQKCFNSGDPAVRIQANFAWNRLVCLARPHQASDSLATLLGKPVAGQMERSGRDRQGNESRMSALSSYCNLLYYAFRPAATHKEYSRSWNEYIVKILRSSFFKRNTANADFACRIFMALTWNSTRVTKVWKETRAHDNTTVEPEELPTIDAKWLRNNCGTVLQMYKLLFTHGTWASSSASDQSYVASAWKHLGKSLGEAASKEIKASSGTVQACGQLVRFVQELWQEGTGAVNASNGDSDTLTERLSFLLRVVIVELGAAPFVEVLGNGTVRLPAALLRLFASTAVEMRNGLHGTTGQLGGAYLPPKSGAPTFLLLEKTLTLLDKRLKDAYEAAVLDRSDIDSTLELLSTCMYDAPENIMILTLQTMRSSLQSWLEDRSRSSTALQPTDFVRTETAQKLTTIVVPCLGRLPHSMIESLDGLFAAGFSSTHKDTINQMVTMWNVTHGQASQMACGPRLLAALKRLRPYVDIDLVDLHLPDDLNNLEIEEDSVPPGFLDFVECQSQLMGAEILEKNYESTEPAQSPMQRHDGPIDTNRAAALAQDNGPTIMSRPQSSHSTPQRKRRHDDSQVLFQPIDSSPLNDMPEESQFLTDRQKEVRNRQRQRPGVYFADLRADIAAKPIHDTIPSGDFGRRALVEERPSTPTLPGAGLADFENDPTASPTPRSKHQTLRLEDIEAPSSPLSAHGDEDLGARDIAEGDASEEAGAENDIEPAIGEDIAMANGLLFTSTEFQGQSPKHQALPDEDGDVTHSATVVVSFNIVPQSANIILQSAPEAPSPGREDVAEAGSAISSEPDATTLDESTSPQGFSPYENGEQSSPTPLDSDELDIMSQSQLSQDLEWHVSEHGDTPEPVPSVEAQDPDQTVLKPLTGTSSQKKRKDAPSLYSGGSKRRKSRSLSRSISETYEERREEMLYDCIEVDTSSRLPLTEFWALQRRSQTADTKQRATPEARSTLDRRPTPADAELENTKTDAQNIPPAPLSTLGSFTHQSLLGDQEQGAQVIPEILTHDMMPTHDQSQPANEAAKVTEKPKETSTRQFQGTSVHSKLLISMTENVSAQPTPKILKDVTTETEGCRGPTEVALQTLSISQPDIGVQAEAGILTSLQDVLERLKQSTGKDLDLRAIDDLCFHIRTEGQNAFNRWTSH